VTGTGTESIGDGVFQQVVDLFEAPPDFNVVGAVKTFNTSQGVTPTP
jgi:hypothetical protein